MAKNKENTALEFINEFIEAWEDGSGGDSDLYKKAKQIVGQIEPLVMRWRPKTETPKNGVRILVYSSCYHINDPMRFRILDSQFWKLLTDADYWAYIVEPSA